MKKRKKPIVKLRSGSRRYERRQAENPHVHKKIMRALMAHAADCAKDRPKYVADFLQLWEGKAKQVSDVAEELLQHQSVEGLTPDLWKSLLAPYEVIQILHFRYIMDRLELEEEERYLAACTALDQAWQKFFSTILVRHPGLTEHVAKLEAARQQAHDETVPLFTGEANPILTPAWARAMMTLEDGLGELAEGLRQ